MMGMGKLSRKYTRTQRTAPIKVSAKQKKKKEPVTIMLLSHTQQKPVQFQLPKWGLGFAVTVMFIIIGITCYNFASVALFKQAAAQKEQLELEKQQLELERQQMAAENKNLKQSSEEQEERLKELQIISDQTLKELDELYKREKDIRDKLGMESVEASINSSSPSSDARVSGVQLSSSALPYPAVTKSPNLIKENLLSVRAEIAAQTEDYDLYIQNITSEQFQKEQKKQTTTDLRQRVAAYAKQFLGGRYVYGQNDPNTGVDCSGFTKYVLSHAAGISISRTAASQSTEGKAVTIENARPGDLLFYGSKNSINHVAMYIGNGKVIHASNERTGIIISPWDYRSVVKIRNVIGD